jgi:proliferating cell nuclear antigen
MKEITDYVNLECNCDGIYIQGMDPARIALMDLNLDRDYFEEFEISDEEEMITLGMNMKLLCAILKCIDSSDELEMESETDSGKVSITIKNNNRKNEFEMNLIDIEQENMQVPEVDHEFILKAEPKEIAKHIVNMNALEVVDVKFNLNENAVYMEGKSDNISMKFELVNRDNEEDLQNNSKVSLVKSNEDGMDVTVSLSYIQRFMKAASVSKTVTYAFTDGMPLFIQFQFTGGNLNYYLAPKIDDD